MTDTNWTPERHEAAKLRCEIAKRQPWTENHVSRTDLPDAIAEIERLQAQVTELKKEMKQLERDAREDIRDATAEARHREQTGDPYGVY